MEGGEDSLWGKRWDERGRRTSLSIFTLALMPSRCWSFWFSSSESTASLYWPLHRERLSASASLTPLPPPPFFFLIPNPRRMPFLHRPIHRPSLLSFLMSISPARRYLHIPRVRRRAPEPGPAAAAAARARGRVGGAVPVAGVGVEEGGARVALVEGVGGGEPAGEGLLGEFGVVGRGWGVVVP